MNYEFRGLATGLSFNLLIVGILKYQCNPCLRPGLYCHSCNVKVYTPRFILIHKFTPTSSLIQRNKCYEGHLSTYNFTVNPSFSHGQVPPSSVNISIHKLLGFKSYRYVSFKYRSMKAIQSSVRAAITFGLQVACLGLLEYGSHYK